MGNYKVNLTKRVLTDIGPRFVPAVYTASGKIKPDYVLIGGKQEYRPEGAYYLDWYEAGKRKRLVIGNDALEGDRQKLAKEATLRGLQAGMVESAKRVEEWPRPLTEREQAEKEALKWLEAAEQKVQRRRFEDECRRDRERFGFVGVIDPVRSIPQDIMNGRLGHELKVKAEQAVQDGLPRCAKCNVNPIAFQHLGFYDYMDYNLCHDCRDLGNEQSLACGE
jgi:hypothetical protein